ncbi:hypothetical protein [Phenylobacterium koreense]|uniref:PRC-barrel domain-containing protein n=1 Tax=Phenylobacterium koreense TaxID=266125 RepID=A0ABV2EIR6_9CAUL
MRGFDIIVRTPIYVGMKRMKMTTGALLGLLLAGAAHAQPASSLEGKIVRGQSGTVLGYVERVITRRDGTPAQVLVRPKGPAAAGPRSLAYKSLKFEGGDLTAPLTQAEFNAMPAVQVAPK